MQFQYVYPEIIIFALAILILGWGLFKKNCDIFIFILVILGLSASIIQSVSLFNINLMSFFDTYFVDNLSVIFKIMVLMVMLLMVLLSYNFKKFLKISYSEFLFLLLFSTGGIMLLSSAVDFIVIYLCLEFISIASYLLSGTTKDNPRAKEGAIKYLLFGAVSSCFMLYGMSFIYGLTGSTNIYQIANFYQTLPYPSSLFTLSFIFLLVGLGFKIAAFPFHMWCPDVYEGAPAPVSAYLSTASKFAGFIIIIRIFLSNNLDIFANVFALLSILSMFVGNLSAISQKNMKRMLAYSSIAQVGYILIAAAVIGKSDIALFSILLYLIAYLFTNLGAFAIVIAVEKEINSDEIIDFSGLSQRSPFLSFSLTIFLLSLLGIPPLVGFLGKFYLFASAIEAGWYLLAIIGIVNSIISAYYYLNVVRVMYFLPPVVPSLIYPMKPVKFAVMVCMVFVSLILIYPSFLLEFLGNFK